MTGSSSEEKEATHKEDNVRTPGDAAPVDVDALPGCTSSRYPPNPDRTPATRRAQSLGSARRSFLGLHIRRTALAKWEKPAAGFPHVRKQAFPSHDAVRCYVVYGIHGSSAAVSYQQQCQLAHAHVARAPPPAAVAVALSLDFAPALAPLDLDLAPCS